MHGPLTEAALKNGLVLQHIGRHMILLDSTTSTNDEAWRYLDSPDADGTVVFAERQTGGRGRLGRSWESPRGASILCSVLVTDPEGQLWGPSLGLVAAIAARDAIQKAAALHAQIQWPNDVMIEDRKVAGVLIEGRLVANRTPDFVVGVGINCLQQRNHFPVELRSRATSLELESSSPIDRHAVASALLRELDYWLDPARRFDLNGIRRAWLERAAPLGQRIRLSHQGERFEGHVIDIDPLANLVVQLDEGQRRIFPAAETSVIHGE